jgi:tRNA (adenine57-N1/adenine58-N1)-methyltransferase catalytic subunit
LPDGTDPLNKIYPDNCSILTSLLDLQPPYPGEKVEILEAGTGHGALTLHLARAIHNSNPRLILNQSPELEATGVKNETPDTGAQNELAKWKATRNSVIHTVDISAKHSEHARNVIQNFRNGVYYNDIDFHVGDLPNFFASYQSDHKQFLTHVVLDMPSADERLKLVSQHLKADGKLLVFNPSITQITDCVRRVSQEVIPLQLERVVELAGSFSGGREWDVRIAKIKNPKKEELITVEGSTSPTKPLSLLSRLFSLFSPSRSEKLNEARPVERNWAIVCRPKAGDRIPVGGFVGIWRRKLDAE